ncbi:MAG: AraC family transcriptional regulator [Proteobacteria bacterium]|nr:AraC family transcriptional regulator [Pseudomonadota bacterium]
MNTQEVNSRNEAEELASSKASFAEKLARLTLGKDDPETAIATLTIRRCEELTELASYIHEPSICLIAQGAKRVLLWEDVYEYDANHYLITSVNLPIVAQVLEASKEKPYLGLKLDLDQRAISQMMVDSNLPMPRKSQADRGMAVSEVSLPLLKSFHRLIDLLDSPADIPILSPLIQKEILYRLLTGEQGRRLRQIASAGSHSHQIGRAIDWLKNNFTEPLKVSELATQVRMSTSTFHHHFRSMTAMSPLQFQKSLRLHEARQLMFRKHMDAATAAFQVGYESPSQFSREYSRQFGAPPLKDIKNLHVLSEGEQTRRTLGAQIG